MSEQMLPGVTANHRGGRGPRVVVGFDKLSYRLPDGRTVLQTSCDALGRTPRRTAAGAGGRRQPCCLRGYCCRLCQTVHGGAGRANPRRQRAQRPGGSPRRTGGYPRCGTSLCEPGGLLLQRCGPLPVPGRRLRQFPSRIPSRWRMHRGGYRPPRIVLRCTPYRRPSASPAGCICRRWSR